MDFNDTPGSGSGGKTRYDLDALANALAATAESWVPLIFPRGRISDDRTELRLANIKGAPPRNTGSCVISLRGERAGSFFDYDPRSGGGSGGPLATLKEATGLSGRALFDRAAELAGYRHDDSAPRWARPAPAKPIDSTAEIAHILKRAKPPAGTLVETYLSARKLTAPPADLLFCDNVSDFKNGVGRPAMVAIVRGADGAATGGIHRTYLAYDGSTKAPVDKPKRMLGPIQHGAVRLFPVGADGILGVAEGLETALAAWAISGLPVWSCLGANNLGGYDKAGAWTGFELPLDVPVARLVIFADRGPAGEAAAAALRDRVAQAGVQVEVRLPASVDDFNGDLLGADVFCETKGPSAIVSRETMVPAPEQTSIWTPRPQGRPPIQPSEQTSTAPPQPQITTPATGAEDIARAIGALTKESHHDEIMGALRMIVQSRANPIAIRQMLNSVKDRTKIPTKALETVLRELRRDNPPPSQVQGDNRAASSQDWMRDIILSESGEPKALLENAAVALEQSPEWKGCIAHDEFSERIVLRQPPPWHGRIMMIIWRRAGFNAPASTFQHRSRMKPFCLPASAAPIILCANIWTA
jgi:putative DNA primase/helicase